MSGAVVGPDAAPPSGPAEPPRPAEPDRRVTGLWHFLTGRPLRFREAVKEQITPVEGLSALSLDALTSVAYGPEAILIVLATAGVAALPKVLPITVAIVVLLTILVISYIQVIGAYPGGGGAYAVSKANLGSGASELAAAALIVDYTLTVAVSIAAGVGALTSAYPSLNGATVPICLGILALVTLLNLRGLGEGARAFLLPTVIFIIGLLAIIAVGLIHPLDAHASQPGTAVVAARASTVGVLLILKAFAAGCSALTGVEAIANGVPLFKEPRVKRAKRTEILLGSILGTMLIGLAVLAVRFHVKPRSNQTVLSQIMAYAVGRNWAYYIVALAITVALALAANTSFGGLPVLASLLARDNRLPHLFSLRGDRLVFSRGIWVLAIMSGALLIAVRGNTNSLIPLFAIGVFTGFTLSQSGLVVHWWRTRPSGWAPRAIINGIGALATGISTVVFLYAKFTEGAWVVVVAIPIFIFMFHAVERYYRKLGHELGLGDLPQIPPSKPTLIIIPVTNVSKLTAQAVSKALSLGHDAVAVTVVFDGEDGSEGSEASLAESACQQDWERWHAPIPLEVLHTEYASVVRPLTEFVDRMREVRADHQIVVLIPVIVPGELRYRVLHNQLDVALSAALRARTDVMVTRVPLSLDEVTSI